MRPSLWGALSLPLDLRPFSILSPTIISALLPSPRQSWPNQGGGRSHSGVQPWHSPLDNSLFQQSSEAEARLSRGETEAVARHKAGTGRSLQCPPFSGSFGPPHPTVHPLEVCSLCQAWARAERHRQDSSCPNELSQRESQRCRSSHGESLLVSLPVPLLMVVAECWW